MAVRKLRFCKVRPTNLTRTHSLQSLIFISRDSSSWNAPLRTLSDTMYRLWDEHSGQREIDTLKVSVQKASTNFDVAIERVTMCRTTVEISQQAHDEAQKLLSNLLLRRDQWDGTDAASFVEYTSNEVKARHQLVSTRKELRKAEEEASRCQQEFMDVMRQRYHEEHVWQEKWRMLGTYGTWILIGLNSIAFFGTQFFHQAREVKRLKAIEELITDNQQKMQQIITSNQSGAMHSVSSMSIENGSKVSGDESKELMKDKALLDTQKEGDSLEEVAESSVKEKSQKAVRSEKMSVFLEDFGNKFDALRNALINDVHIPSVLVGAAASASLFCIVVILTNKK
jgi:She9 / Mdm33 family